MADDLDARRSRYMPAPPAADSTTPPATDMPTITVTAPKPDDGLDERRQRYQMTTGTQAQTATPPAPTYRDNIFPNARAAIAQDPNATYGDVLPLKRDASGIHLAWPGNAHLLANGLLDLIEGTHTGTVTPEGTNALLTAAMMRPGLMGETRVGFPESTDPKAPFSFKNMNSSRPLGLTKNGEQVFQDFMPDGKTQVGGRYYYAKDANGRTVRAPFSNGDPIPEREFHHPDFDPDDYPNQPPIPTAPEPPANIPNMPRMSPETADRIAKGLGAVGGALGGAAIDGTTAALVGGVIGPYVGELLRPAAAWAAPYVGRAIAGGVNQLFDSRNLLALQPWHQTDGQPVPQPQTPTPSQPNGNQILLPRVWPSA